MSDEALLTFPCAFPIKVMGRDDEAFRSRTRAIVEHHAGPLDEASVMQRASSGGRFLALTYTIDARSRAQLDAIYQDLTDSGVVLVAL